jgi:hypothetical protein
MFVRHKYLPENVFSRFDRLFFMSSVPAAVLCLSGSGCFFLFSRLFFLLTAWDFILP